MAEKKTHQSYQNEIGYSSFFKCVFAHWVQLILDKLASKLYSYTSRVKHGLTLERKSRHLIHWHAMVIA